MKILNPRQTRLINSYAQRKKSRSKAFFLPNTNGSHSGSGRSNSPKDDYDEIEQIYDYVRGFAPLPRSAKGWRYENSAAAAAAAAAAMADANRNCKEETDTLNGSGGSYKSRQQMQQSPVPPVPPPIETIPSLQQHLAQPMEYTATTPPRTPSWYATQCCRDNSLYTRASRNLSFRFLRELSSSVKWRTLSVLKSVKSLVLTHTSLYTLKTESVIYH